MRVLTNIFRRGAVFYHRQVVPKDLVAITNCRELKLSLRTRCPHTARPRGAVVQLRAKTLFAYLRRKTSLLPLQAQTAIQVFSLIGLDRTAVSDAFSSFVAGSSATSEQIEFIDMIVEHLTERGVMDPGLLYESPFTDISPSGPERVFNLERTRAFIDAIERFNDSAAG